MKKENKYTRDTLLRFNCSSHTYYVGDEEMLSVTRFVSSFFPSFDPKKALKVLSDKKRNTEYKGMTDEEILKTWKKKGKKSSERGTYAHNEIEQFLLGNSDTKKIPEFQHFLNFFNANNYDSYRVEWQLFDEEFQLAGTLDWLAIDENTGEFVIVDWKTNDKLNKRNMFESGYAPIADLEKSEYNIYSLQLNLYRRILERNYGIFPKKLLLVRINQNLSNYEVLDVPVDNYYVDLLLKHRLQQLQSELKGKHI